MPKVLTGMTLRLSIDPPPEVCGVQTCVQPIQVVWGRPIGFEARLDPYLWSLQQPRPPDGLVPTGTVTFFDLKAVLGTVPVVDGVARFTASFRPRGDHGVHAEYSGDAVFRGSGTPERHIWAGTPTGDWAAAFLEDFFASPPSHDWANTLGRAVDEHGQSRLQVAAGIANGYEHRQHLVDDLHRRLLGRPADQSLLVALAGGHVDAGWDPTVASYRPGLMGEGHILETVEALLFGTEEYYVRVGRTPDSYVENLWLQTVQRPSTPAERSVVLGWLRGGLSRTTLAQAVLYSVDYRRVQARTLFQRFFGRPGDPAGVDAWTKALQRGVRIEDAMAAFVDTDEFLRLHGIPRTAP